MRKLNKILIIPIIFSCLILNLVSADDSDCEYFAIQEYQNSQHQNSFNVVDATRETNDNPYTNFLSIEQQRNIITKEDLNTAILNLKKYCCENQLWWVTQNSSTCKNDSAFFNDNTPDSPYLFDHLFDVIMRRLNWLNWDTNIYSKTKMTLDDKWLERRTRIDEKAESISGSTPESIINEYIKTWSASSPNSGYNIAPKIYSTFILGNNDFLRYVSWKWWSESEDVAKAIKEYKERTLYDRYLNACALSEYFYSLLNQSQANPPSKNTVIRKIAQSSCDQIIERQINWENTYVQVVTKRSSTQFMSNYVEWYINYLYNREETLMKLWNDTKNKRFDVVKAVPCLQRKCVK